MDQYIDIKVRVWRQAGPKAQGHFETYELKHVFQGASFLEMIDILNEQLVAEHKDKDDKAQTVTVSKPPLDSPKTGDESSLLIWIAIAAIAAGLGGFITAREVRKRKDRE